MAPLLPIDPETGAHWAPATRAAPAAAAVASDAAARYLAAVGDVTLGGVETIPDVRVGEVVPRLLEVLEPADLVVLLNTPRCGVRRWLRGSMADTLVRHASAPVCLVPAAMSRGHRAE